MKHTALAHCYLVDNLEVGTNGGNVVESGNLPCTCLADANLLLRDGGVLQNKEARNPVMQGVSMNDKETNTARN